ncbi:FlhB/HrpN/YscU/SpaS domain protein [Peptostreptococcaceae bacterium AS15]|nr:hypothetical protein HMPREF0379_1279 [[Eubacterium] yurii subsp. margaretiae ATCC 43715]EJP20310.1 FlhB/HrpN/YscU/SpaS domain protein [Peptostreptococcaceae bacterium AS15]
MNNKEKNKILSKKAVALEYDEQYNAPVVSAKGSGYVAMNMLEKARLDGISTYFDEDLLNSLMALSIGDEIPYQLYDIVAKVLQYVESIDSK